MPNVIPGALFAVGMQIGYGRVVQVMLERIPRFPLHQSDALRSWLATAKEFKDPVLAPSVGLSGKWVRRVPKSLHAKLAAKAEKEGVSLNTLVVSLIAEGSGRRAN